MTLTVKVDISSITGENPEKKRTASYAAGTGNPSWVTVATNGDIDLSNPSQSDKDKDVDIKWTLPSGYAFHSTTPFGTNPTSSDFSVTAGKGGTTLTVNDTNADTSVGTQYEYTLYLSDGTSIDPKVINY